MSDQKSAEMITCSNCKSSKASTEGRYWSPSEIVNNFPIKDPKGNALISVAKSIVMFNPNQANMSIYFICKDCVPQKSKTGCFIATLCYGSSTSLEVIEFKRFRDQYLSKTIAGHLFIKIYYKTAPLILEIIESFPNLKRFIRKYILDLLLQIVRRMK